MVALNIFYGLISRVAPKIATTLFFIILLRDFGSHAAGAFSLAIAFLTLMVLVSSFGLDELIIREVASKKSSKAQFLTQAFCLRLFFSLVTYCLFYIIIAYGLNYTAQVKFVILLIAVAVIPEGLIATAFSIFNAHQKISWLALVSLVITSVQVGLGLPYVYLIDLNLNHLIIIFLLGDIAGTVVCGYLYRLLKIRSHEPSLSFRSIKWDPFWQQVKSTAPLALLIALSSLDLQLDLLLLSILAGVKEVGLYNAGRVIILLLTIIAQSSRIVIYPLLVKNYASSPEDTRILYTQAWKYLALTALPLAGGVYILSPDIVFLLYHQSNPTSVQSLQILSFFLLANFLYLPSTRLLIAGHHQGWLSFFLFNSIITNGLLNAWLVPGLGAVGTAVARAVSSVLFFIGAEIGVSFMVPRLNAAYKKTVCPLLATLIMMLTMYMIADYHLFIKISGGIFTYLSVWFLLSKICLASKRLKNFI